MRTNWVVEHWEETVDGERIAFVDGVGLNWTKEQAEAHAERCEYAANNIAFNVVQRKEVRKGRSKKASN